MDGQARADGRGHRLLDQHDLFRARVPRALSYSAFFDTRNSRGNADRHARCDEAAPVVDLLHEVAEHRFGDLEVGDHAVFHGPYRDNVPGSPADHAFRLAPNSADLVIAITVNRHDGRLAENDPLSLYVDKGVRRTKVDPHVVREQTGQSPKKATQDVSPYSRVLRASIFHKPAAQNDLKKIPHFSGSIAKRARFSNPYLRSPPFRAWDD